MPMAPTFPGATTPNLEELTKQFLAHFYRHDATWCLPLCAPDVTYLGSMQDGYAFGAKALKVFLERASRTYSPGLAVATETHLSEIDEGSAIVLARYYVINDPGEGRVHARRRRSSIVWVASGGGPKVKHLHLTLPLQANVHGSAVFREIPSETVRYAEALINQVIRRSAATLLDTRGTIHRIAPIEVRYVEAARQRTVVHCLNKDIVVRRSFGAVVEELGESLLRVHRSFAINPHYVREVSSAAVVLDDESSIPLPQRHARETRQRIMEALDVLANEQKSWPNPLHAFIQDETDGAVGALLGFRGSAPW